MKHNRTRLLNTFLLITVLLLFFGCKRTDDGNKFLRKTSLNIEDSIRHYYPIIRGSKLNLTVKIFNTGDYPLKIYNILPSCGCVIAKYTKRPIPVEGFGLIQMEYESGKNIGYVGIYTTILANTRENSHTMFFDVNVVSSPHYTQDYEEIYNEEKEEESSTITEMVDGNPNQRGYVVDSLYGISF